MKKLKRIVLGAVLAMALPGTAFADTWVSWCSTTGCTHCNLSTGFCIACDLITGSCHVK